VAKLDAATGTYFIIEDYTLVDGEQGDVQEVVNLVTKRQLHAGDDGDCEELEPGDMVYQDDGGYNVVSAADYSEMISEQEISDTGILLSVIQVYWYQ